MTLKIINSLYTKLIPPAILHCTQFLNTCIYISSWVTTAAKIHLAAFWADTIQQDRRNIQPPSSGCCTGTIVSTFTTGVQPSTWRQYDLQTLGTNLPEHRLISKKTTTWTPSSRSLPRTKESTRQFTSGQAFDDDDSLLVSHTNQIPP